VCRCAIENGGTLETYLSSVKTWLDVNPTDVVTLLIVNSDDLAASTFATAFQTTRLSSLAYAPGTAALSKSAWPTLSALISTRKPLVVFIDNSADVSTVPYILPHFSNTWENPYGQTSTPFNCSVDRIDAGSPAGNLMYLVNHYLDTSFTLFGTTVYVPDTAKLSTTNSVASVMADADNCASLHGGVYPTYVLTDFYDVGGGSVFEAAARMNGVQYTARAVGSATKGGAGSGSKSSAAVGAKVGVGAGAVALVAVTLALALASTLL